mmetsp:Transcript_3851/g.5840  ORF Transcript_3851/g.5840 Transcript_3851/m.5840 type:complete len:194 (-) Transcript_3851:123-704(-)
MLFNPSNRAPQGQKTSINHMSGSSHFSTGPQFALEPQQSAAENHSSLAQDGNTYDRIGSMQTLQTSVRHRPRSRHTRRQWSLRVPFILAYSQPFLEARTQSNFKRLIFVLRFRYREKNTQGGSNGGSKQKSPPSEQANMVNQYRKAPPARTAGIVCRETETETHTLMHTHTHRERERDRQRDRQRDTWTERET